MEGKVFKSDTQTVGIVVIGRNEGQRLLLSLSAAKALCNHVVYVDSASSDGSADSACRLGVAVVVLDAARPFTAARARHAGMDRLMGEMRACRYIQFIDGDCILQPNWLSAAVRFLDDNPDVAVVCGRRFEANSSQSFYNRLIDAEWATPIGPTTECGGDSLMRVGALREVGSFRDDLLAGEEPELCARLRAQDWGIWRIDESMTEHEAGITHFGQWWRRAKRGGFGYAQVWASTRRTSFPLYARQMTSALAWGAALPLGSAALSIAIGHWWPIVVAAILYVTQIGRIARRRDPIDGLGFRLKAGATTMLVKHAESLGIIRYWLNRDGGQVKTYKDSPALLSPQTPAD